MKTLAFVLLLQTGPNPGPEGAGFPTLAELEQLLPESLELRAIKIELEKHKLQHSWVNAIKLHANYSQRFSSPVPFIPSPNLTVSGGTYVGVSVSVSLGKLLGKPTPEKLDRRLKELEYERVYEQKLASLRLLYRRRAKLVSQQKALAAQAHTANLKLEKVKVGLRLMRN